ncbi:CLUMA_CG000273, isoform A [Clunio marinus]|uniref:CLUMA_CG000273, isoform A n=1 Tax=Clunio marinus TaxID=568069 RepID=A0A1J1HJT2_9DIPT|nr:CLUMA_CG000273, isoform A [Clunio marinus]
MRFGIENLPHVKNSDCPQRALEEIEKTMILKNFVEVIPSNQTRTLQKTVQFFIEDLKGEINQEKTNILQCSTCPSLFAFHIPTIALRHSYHFALMSFRHHSPMDLIYSLKSIKSRRALNKQLCDIRSTVDIMTFS